MSTTLSPPPRLDDEPHLTLAGHLDELRRRLALSLAAWLIGVGVSLTQLDRLLGWLQHPAGVFLSGFAYFTPTEPLVAYLKVALLGGTLLAMPVFLAQGWGFIRGGLTWPERRLGRLFIWWGSAQFLLGAAVAYLVLVPAALRMLLSIGQGRLLPMLSIDRYLAFVTTLIFWCGVVFELPVVLALLARVGIVTTEWLRQQRPFAILVLVILAAIVTPTTDPVNLLLLAIPLILLYEFSILITRWMVPRPSPRT